VLAAKLSRAEESVAERRALNSEGKARIARAALRFIPPTFSGAVVLDAGTTTGHLADQLARWTPDAPHQSLVVITNSLTIATSVSENADVEVQLLGGRVRGITSAAIGPTTIAQLARLRADLAFIGANGLDATFGFSTADDEESAVKSAITHGARRAVALVDSSKLGEQKLSRFAELGDIDTLITDRRPNDELSRALDTAGVEVIVA
jgi:DeoR family fructose operon transcriptional repressor